MGSSGFLLPMLARGLYREMLTQAWRRGAELPNDPETIRRAIGATELEWAQGWPLVSRFWRVSATNTLINDTQIQVYQQAQSIQRVRSEAGRLGGLSTQAKRQANKQADFQAKFNPPSPSPSPSLISVSDSDTVSEKNKKEHGPHAALSSAHADFEAFRSAYPASRRVGGKNALRAFQNATRGRNGTHFTAMIDALAQHKRSEQWQSPKLIPLMTTWLNQERWTQVLPETIPQKRMGDGGRWNCYHDPSCRTISDCSAKIIAEGRAEKAAR